MAGLRALLYLSLLASVSKVHCLFGSKSSVVKVRKQYDITTLTSKEFYDFNIGHILFYYAVGITKADLEPVKEVNELQYTGSISVGYNEYQMDVYFNPNMADVFLLSSKHKDCGLFQSLCRNHKPYDMNKSFKSKKAVRIEWEEKEGPTFQLFRKTLPISGHLVFDQIKIGNLTIPTRDCLIWMVERGYLYGKADGVVGVGKQAESYLPEENVISSKSDSDQLRLRGHSFTEALKAENSSKIGIQLFNGKKAGEEIGDVIFKANNERSRYVGKIAWFDQPKTDLCWRLQIKKIEIKWAPKKDEALLGTLDEVIPNATQGLAIVDPGTSLIAGPVDLIDDINKKLFHEMGRLKKTTSYKTIEFNCDHMNLLPNVIFKTDGQDFLLEPSYYVRKLSGICTTGFLGVPKLQSLILGDTFMKRYFVIFDNETNRMGLAESKN